MRAKDLFHRQNSLSLSELYKYKFVKREIVGNVNPIYLESLDQSSLSISMKKIIIFVHMFYTHFI